MLLAALVAAPVLAQSMDAPQRAALNAAERWLVPVDNERYADAWAMASDTFKATIPRQEWRDGIRKIRKPYGRVVLRKGDSIAFVGAAPPAPDQGTQAKSGMKVAILFDTKFAGSKQAVEEITLVLESDGIWRVASYYIK
ncbi:MAG: DUF4019 domain-containing protein [Burkholderiales bacterium]|nr:DUF4019 domain-containing protein [Burkholderiales bacterium]